MNLTVIITAGGIGKRMNSSIPKQFLTINHKPILMHTIERFYQFDKTAQLLVTLPSDWWEFWEDLTQEYNFNLPITLVAGGVERYDSIKAALKHVKGDIVAVHDGVRPCVSLDTIKQAVQCAKTEQAVVPVLPLKESIRKGTFTTSEATDRSCYFTVQTPQCFTKDVLKKAYEQPFTQRITDDASLVEQTGQKITLIQGNAENIKITEPLDLKIASLFL